MNSYWLFVAGVAVSWGVAAMAVTWLARDVGLLSLGHNGFMASGAYVFALAVNAGVPWPLALLLAAGVTVGLGFILGSFGGAVRGAFGAVVTLSFGLALQRAAMLLGRWTGGSQGLAVPDLPGLHTDAGRLATTVCVAAVVWAVTVTWQRGYLGACWRLQRDRPDVATSYGLSPLRLRRLALGLSAGTAAVAGALLTLHTGYVSPYDYGSLAAFQLVVAAAVGGLGSLPGAFAAAALLAIIPAVAGALTVGVRPEWHVVTQGGLLLAAVLGGPSLRSRLLPWLHARARSGQRAAAQTPASRHERGRTAAELSATADDELIAWVERSGAAGRPGSLTADNLQIARGELQLGPLQLSLAPGTVTVLHGQNGSGKSTLLGALSGHVAAGGQRSLSVGERARRLPQRASEVARLGLSRTWQGGGLAPGLTVAEQLVTAGWSGVPLWRAAVPGLTWRRWRRDLAAVHRLGGPLSGLTARSTAAVSGGQAGLIQLLAAARRRPAVLLLDEPFAGMAPAYRRLAKAVLKRLCDDGTAILLVEHQHVTWPGAVVWQLDVTGELRTPATRGPAALAVEAAATGQQDSSGAGPVVLRLNNVCIGAGAGPPLSAPINLEIRAGTVTGISGANGSGKSTLLAVMSGLLPARSGEMSASDGAVLPAGVLGRVKRGIVLLPQYGNVFADLTVEENLRLAASGLARRQRRQAVSDVLTELPMLAAWRRRRAGQLSGGQRQLLGLARALLLQPVVLLLDEPTAGLDQAGQRTVAAIVAQLRSAGVAIVIAEQNEVWLRAVADRQFVLSPAGLLCVTESADSGQPC